MTRIFLLLALIVLAITLGPSLHRALVWWSADRYQLVCRGPLAPDAPKCDCTEDWFGLWHCEAQP